MIDLALKKIDDLEKKLERYYQLLFISDELDMILKGFYILEEDLQGILNGSYQTK